MYLEIWAFDTSRFFLGYIYLMELLLTDSIRFYNTKQECTHWGIGESSFLCFLQFYSYFTIIH